MTAAFLTTAEAAEVLGVSTHTVIRYIKSGTLPAAPLPKGSPYRIPRRAIEAMVDVDPVAPEPELAVPRPLEYAAPFAPRSARAQAQQGRRRVRAA